MSAFIVNDHHINVLVTWASWNDVRYYHPGFGWKSVAGSEDKTARILAQENLRSVNHRYAEDEPLEFGGFCFADRGSRGGTITPVEIIKACHCLAYQSCEHDEWEGSEAKRILDAIEDRAVSLLPGYDNAEWELRP